MTTKEKIAKQFAKIVLKQGIREVDSACRFIYNQPAIPEKLKKMMRG